MKSWLACLMMCLLSLVTTLPVHKVLSPTFAVGVVLGRKTDSSISPTIWRWPPTETSMSRTTGTTESKSSTAPATTLGSGECWTGPTQFNRPSGIAVSSTGNVYVGEYSDADHPDNHRVQEFDSSGGFVRATTGGMGTAPGQFQYVYGVAVGPTGNVYVADSGNYQSQEFDSSLNCLTSWSLAGHPVDVAVGANGDVYVADPDNHRIQVFDSNGSFLRMWGSYGTGEGQFLWPRSLTVAPDGDVYVADFNGNRVEVFDSSGSYITQISTFNNGDTFNGPSGIAVSPSGDIYVADHANNRIVEFSAVPEPSTFVIFGVGTIGGLLAYAWRRRKGAA